MESAAIGILALSGIAAVAAMVAFAFGRHVVSALDTAFAKWRRLGFLGRIITAAMVVVAAVEAQKGGVKKSKSQVEVEQRTGNNSIVQLGLPTLTHFLVSVKTNTSYSYEMPPNAVRYPNWWMRGGYEDVFQLDFGEWRFPLGTASVSSLWVYTWGNARSCLRGGYEIAAVGAPMSAVPQFSQFWHSDGTNGSKILTWHNFFHGRVLNSASLTNSITHPLTQFILSAQLELFPNGDYIARSNLVERAYKRINPDDFDDDGIPNDIDANPEGNDGENFGPYAELPEDANSNNYCWVELVVSNANSLVTFDGDRPSNLPDPYFVAKVGESYRVNLLIGKTYRVSSAQPIVCTAKSSEEISVDQDDERTMTIVYPVSYEIVDAMRSVSRQIRMVPPLVGSIQWDTNSCPCHTQANSTSFNLPMCYGACSCYSCDPGGFTFNYEGYSLSFSGVECDCAPYVPDEEDDGPYAASASVSFSKSAVIFEDAYMNTPTESVPRRSTSTILTCTAHGGPNGGRATFTLANAEKLVRVSGVELPIEVDVSAGHKVSFDIVYEGGEASGAENDIVATAQFVDNKDGELEKAESELTSIEVKLMAEERARGNPCESRHVFGVYELVNFLAIPSVVDMDIDIQDVQENLVSTDNTKFFCPWTGGTYSVMVNINDVNFTIDIVVFEPKVVCREVSWVDIGVDGQSGLLDMRLDLFIEPTIVSFKDLYMVEVPDDVDAPREGYFATGGIEKTGALSHTESAGAGIWGAVRSDGSWMRDRVGRGTSYPQPWSAGWKEWRIPVAWGDYLRNIKGMITPDPTTEKFTIDAEGTATVRKYNHEIKRTIDNRIWIDNVLQRRGGK